MYTLSRTFMIITLLFIFSALCLQAAPVNLEAKVFERSVVSVGNTTRLQRAMIKAQKGGKFVVGVIGGSITQGAKASTADKTWGSLVAKWWKEQFPKADVQFVNAGIGATGSLIAAHRERKDLLRFNPDVVVCEFAVNDGNDQSFAETLEGVVRQILVQKNSPAVMLLFTMTNTGGNAQEWLSKVGKQYDLPMVSARDALAPEVEAGRMKWTDFLADEVHPNDDGHAYYAGFVTHLLDSIKNSIKPGARMPRANKVAKPLISDVFEHAAMYNAESITPVVNNGWNIEPTNSFFGKGWIADKPGSSIEFEVEGDTISLLYFRIKRDMGIAEAQVDDKAPVKMDAWFDQDWGGYSAFVVLGRNLGPGKHKVKVHILDERAEKSNGSRFELQAVLVAGKEVK